MTVEVKYICDRCGKTQTPDGQLWKVQIQYTELYSNRQYKPVNSAMMGSDKRSADWCRTCMVAAHILRPAVPEEVTLATNTEIQTLDQMVREIVREEIAEAQE